MISGSIFDCANIIYILHKYSFLIDRVLIMIIVQYLLRQGHSIAFRRMMVKQTIPIYRYHRSKV